MIGTAVRRTVAVLAGLALAAGLVLTGLRLAGGDTRQVAWGQAFAPWAIPAYAVAVLLASGLLALLVRSGRTSVRRTVLACLGVALVGLVLHVVWVAPMYVGSAAEPDEDTLTVMTANLRLGEAEPEDVVAAAADDDVDLLVVQEITPEALDGLERSGIAALLPHRGGTPGPGATGTMAFSRTPVAAVDPLGTAMDSFSFRTAGLRVVAVHPAYPLDPRWAEELALVRDALDAADPDVVLGDFNASLDHAPMRAILATGLRDAAEEANAGWQPTWPADRGFHGLPLPPAVAIDHVLVGTGATAVRTTTRPVEGTDHLALVAELATS